MAPVAAHAGPAPRTREVVALPLQRRTGAVTTTSTEGDNDRAFLVQDRSDRIKDIPQGHPPDSTAPHSPAVTITEGKYLFRGGASNVGGTSLASSDAAAYRAASACPAPCS